MPYMKMMLLEMARANEHRKLPLIALTILVLLSVNTNWFVRDEKHSIAKSKSSETRIRFHNHSAFNNNNNVTDIIQTKRRTKLHLCSKPKRTKHGNHILTEELGFQHVDASTGDDWDVMFGGYPYCGTKKNDYEMKSGINKVLLEQGFDTLKPHQVFHPCMGCTDTYCNKEKLCRLQREIDPESCYLLPEDEHVLIQKMKQDPTKSWVLKHDSSVSAVHSGQGVKIINSIQELPSNTTLKKENYLVQPFVDSYLGDGDWRRKTEVRYYVAITSITPLRVYFFNDQWMPLSSTLWVDDPPSELYKRCMQDSHAYNAKCSKGKTTTRVQGEKRVRFADYQKATKMPRNMVESFHKQAIATMTKIFEKSHSVMQDNSINQGITSSGASCFSFMRADFGISSTASAFLYEINELPYGREPHIAGQVQMNAYRDLFQMIGLADTPLPAGERAAYEAIHAGNWTLLPTFVK